MSEGADTEGSSTIEVEYGDPGPPISSDRDGCSHPGCGSKLPVDEDKIPDGWTAVRVEEYARKTVRTYHIYLCPGHALATVERQADLFGGE